MSLLNTFPVISLVIPTFFSLCIVICLVLIANAGNVDHVAVAHVFVSSEFVRNKIETFEGTYIIGAHKSVLNSYGITVHTALVITAEESVYIKLHEIVRLFGFRQERPVKGLLPPDDPGLQGVFHELKRLLFDV